MQRNLVLIFRKMRICIQGAAGIRQMCHTRGAMGRKEEFGGRYCLFLLLKLLQKMKNLKKTGRNGFSDTWQVNERNRGNYGQLLSL